MDEAKSPPPPACPLKAASIRLELAASSGSLVHLRLLEIADDLRSVGSLLLIGGKVFFGFLRRLFGLFLLWLVGAQQFHILRRRFALLCVGEQRMRRTG